jgi:polysaccharide export outer membrane protein
MSGKHNFHQLLALPVLIFVSCTAYKQDILFQLPEDQSILEASIYDAEKNYLIQPNDWLELYLFYNDGETLINPNAELLDNPNSNQLNQNRQRFRYLVQINGDVKMPLIGTQNIGGLTIDQAEKKLEVEFNKIYKGAFLKMSFLNKRVTVLGALSTVVPLDNENTSLLEVLALAGGVQFGAKAQNIRILRGDFDDPVVFEVDLSTVAGMRASMLTVHPGDVIYIEPWRRTWLEGLRDISPVIGITSSVSTLVFLLINTLNTQ